MSALFEELDYCPTPIGAVSLRRRRDLKLDVDVFEIRLGDESLMTSLFTASEIALARRGLAALGTAAKPDVVVGGLGLGYTAHAVLEASAGASLIVVEALAPVIEWHQSGVLPLGTAIANDPRCQLVQGDFFAMAASDEGFDPQAPGRQLDAILVDIDHSPEALLDERSESFYRTDGLRRLARHLRPGGVFGLWSDALPDESFLARLGSVFAEARAEPVTFHNPLQDRPFTQTVYLARAYEKPAS
ncbi:MAG: spermidine synthase [Methyloceanibacter sp.]|nr:spermidine synthase [Methyloceanibacter sp.]